MDSHSVNRRIHRIPILSRLGVVLIIFEIVVTDIVCKHHLIVRLIRNHRRHFVDLDRNLVKCSLFGGDLIGSAKNFDTDEAVAL